MVGALKVTQPRLVKYQQLAVSLKPLLLGNGYMAQAKVCPEAASTCSKFVDPSASEEANNNTYYILDNQLIDRQSCNGLASQKLGCVLFNNYNKVNCTWSKSKISGCMFNCLASSDQQGLGSNPPGRLNLKSQSRSNVGWCCGKAWKGLKPQNSIPYLQVGSAWRSRPPVCWRLSCCRGAQRSDDTVDFAVGAEGCELPKLLGRGGQTGARRTVATQWGPDA